MSKNAVFLAIAGIAVLGAARRIAGRAEPEPAAPTAALRSLDGAHAAPQCDAAQSETPPAAEDWRPRSPLLSSADPIERAEDGTDVRAAIESPPAAIAGRVLWPDGSPAAGVAVRAELDPFVLGAETSTGVEGEFALAVGGEGPFRVVAEADRSSEAHDGAAGVVERFSATAAGIAPGSVGLRLVLDAGFVLAGRVRDDLGTPLDDFAIQAVPFGHGRELSRSFRDARGTFELGGLASGTWVLVAHADGHGKGERIERTLPGDAAALDFVLPRAGEIRGVVLGPDGAPVGSAEVLLDGGARPRARRARTDAEGRFAFERTAAGPCRLVAWSEDLPESEPVELDLRAGETASGVELRLPAR